jgi:hypothetical protein
MPLLQMRREVAASEFGEGKAAIAREHRGSGKPATEFLLFALTCLIATCVRDVRFSIDVSRVKMGACSRSGWLLGLDARGVCWLCSGIGSLGVDVSRARI